VLVLERAIPSPPARWAQSQLMSSQPNTRRTVASQPRSPAPQPVEPPARGGLDVTTLVAAAVASVVAATVVSRLWQAGTVWATAMTPVIVALVKEAVERPAKRVSSIATRAAAPPLARATRAVAEPPPEAYAPPPPVVGPDPGLSEMRVYRRERATGRHWKLAIATGLLACVIAVAAMTLPELVAGRSVVSGSHHTTIFGGHRSTPSSTTKTKTDEKKTTSTDQTTSTETQPQDTTTQPDTTTTAPNGQAPTTTAPAPTQTPAPSTTQPPAAQTQPPATTQPPPATP
jgi:hypothetical protein